MYRTPENECSADRPRSIVGRLSLSQRLLNVSYNQLGASGFVSSTEVVCFSECPLSEVPLYIHVRMHV